jgi:sec-independent protein translocase protein TatA
MIGDILQPTHLLFVLVVALLVLGPKRLPEAGRALGKGIRDFRTAVSGEDQEHSSIMSAQASTAVAPPPATAAPEPNPAATAVAPPAAPQVADQPASPAASPSEPLEHTEHTEPTGSANEQTESAQPVS